MSFHEHYPPAVDEVIHASAREDVVRELALYENDDDDGAPWILHAASEDKEFWQGLSEDQADRIRDGMLAVTSEVGGSESPSMFQ